MNTDSKAESAKAGMRNEPKGAGRSMVWPGRRAPIKNGRKTHKNTINTQKHNTKKSGNRESEKAETNPKGRHEGHEADDRQQTRGSRGARRRACKASAVVSLWRDKPARRAEAERRLRIRPNVGFARAQQLPFGPRLLTSSPTNGTSDPRLLTSSPTNGTSGPRLLTSSPTNGTSDPRLLTSSPTNGGRPLASVLRLAITRIKKACNDP